VCIGARAVLQAGTCVGDNSKLGDDVNLFPNVTIYPERKSAGASAFTLARWLVRDGFGLRAGRRRSPQGARIGNVIIGDDVEIVANVTIDRGARSVRRSLARHEN